MNNPFSIGDRVVTVSLPHDHNVPNGRHGCVVEVRSDMILVDFGEGFNGHDGGSRQLETMTGWFIYDYEYRHLEIISTNPQDFILVTVKDGVVEHLEGHAFKDGKQAGAHAKLLSEKLGVKVQPRRLKSIQNLDWRSRERHRLESGHYKSMPEQWDLDPIPDHFLHMSRDRSDMLAYTPDEQSGMIDRKVRLRPGRYLERFYPELSQKSRQHYAAIALAQGELKFTQDPELIKRIYKEGPRSCMSDAFSHLPCHPSEIYCAGDLSLAYIEQEGKFIARCICWPEKKIHTRPYGMDGTSGFDQILALLSVQGYKEQSLVGARLRKVPYRDTYICPYLDAAKSRLGDPNSLCVKVEKDCLRIVLNMKDGDYRANNHDTAVLRYRDEEDENNDDELYLCDSCEMEFVLDDLTAIYDSQTGRRVARYCQDCRDEYAVLARDGAYYIRPSDSSVEHYMPDGRLAPAWRIRAGHYSVCSITGHAIRQHDVVKLADGRITSIEYFEKNGYCNPDDGLFYLNNDPQTGQDTQSKSSTEEVVYL